MSPSTSDDKYSGIPFFDGKDGDFPEFEIKLISFLETKDLEEYALKDKDIKPKVEAKAKKDSTDPVEKALWEDYQEDKKTLGYIKRYLKGSPLLLIKDCRTAYEAWTNIIVKKHSLGDEDIDFDDLKLRFDESKLANDKDPEIWFKELEVLNLKIKEIDPKYMEDEREVTARICNQMCDEYDKVVKAFKRQKSMMTVVTKYEDLMKMLKKMVIDHWRSEVNGKRGGKISGLNFHVGTDGKARIICGHCGKPGHAEEKCWKKHGKPKGDWKDNKQGTGRRTKRCWLCGGDHSKIECPKYKGNKGNKGKGNEKDE